MKSSVSSTPLTHTQGSDKTATARLTFDRAPASAALVNLEEQHPVALPTEGDSLTLEMAPYAIRTVYLTF